MKYFWMYLLIINLFTFFTYGIDKYKAQKHQWRISERTLLSLAAIGGFVGAILGMQLFRHKTKHVKFVIGVPAIAVLWMAGLIYYLSLWA